LFAVLVLLISFKAASMLGLEALGQSNDGVSAPFLGRGYAGNAKTGRWSFLWNPASLAFEEMVRFTANISYEKTAASEGKGDLFCLFFNIPSISLSFPLGRFGALAWGWVQHILLICVSRFRIHQHRTWPKLEYQEACLN
jgi:hypothetical protein